MSEQKYKISVIKDDKYGWIAVLEVQKRFWIFRYYHTVEICTDPERPYSPKVVQWQREYNIPDKRVKIF